MDGRLILVKVSYPWLFSYFDIVYHYNINIILADNVYTAFIHHNIIFVVCLFKITKIKESPKYVCICVSVCVYANVGKRMCWFTCQSGLKQFCTPTKGEQLSHWYFPPQIMDFRLRKHFYLSIWLRKQSTLFILKRISLYTYLIDSNPSVIKFVIIFWMAFKIKYL